MTTATKKPTAKKPASPKTSAQKTTTRKTTSKAAQQRNVKTVVLDSAYATVGLTETAVALLKAFPEKAPGTVKALREEAPVRVKNLSSQAPQQVAERFQSLTGQSRARVLDLRTEAEKQLDTYAGRGREVVGKVLGSATTKRALDQTRVARSQVKAAATSVRKAVGASADAAEHAAERIGETA